MNRLALALLVSFSFIALVSCSPANSTSSTSQPTTSDATNTPRQAIIPTYAFVQPTVAPQIATAAATLAATTGAGDPVRIQRGRERYEVLACWGCHGENGEGVEGRGGALLNLQLTETDFITLMRTAITLEDGTIHQFSTNLLSESGGRNLYAYLQSIQQDQS